MIHYIKGDIFESKARVLVNPVNTVGVMGKGLALQFKTRYPKMFTEYKAFCDKGMLYVGELHLWNGNDHDVLNFPTKKHWRNPSKLEYIETGLKQLKKEWKGNINGSIAFTRLGCGCGGLDWKDVKPLMEKYLKDLPLEIYIYE